jgi:hypothetical protein
MPAAAVSAVAAASSSSSEEEALKIFDTLDPLFKPGVTPAEPDIATTTKTDQVLVIPKEVLNSTDKVATIDLPKQETNLQGTVNNVRRMLRRRGFWRRIGRAISRVFRKAVSIAKFVVKRVVLPAIKVSLQVIQKVGPIVGPIAGAVVGGLVCGPACAASGFKLGGVIGSVGKAALDACPPEYGSNGAITGINCSLEGIVKSGINLGAGYLIKNTQLGGAILSKIEQKTVDIVTLALPGK